MKVSIIFSCFNLMNLFLCLLEDATGAIYYVLKYIVAHLFAHKYNDLPFLWVTLGGNDGLQCKSAQWENN